MHNERLRDTARSRMSSTHNEPPPSPRAVACDGCQLVRTLEARVSHVESLQRADGLDLAQLTGSVMAAIEDTRRDIVNFSDLLGQTREAVARLEALLSVRSTTDSVPVKAGTVEAKLGDKWRFRGSGIVAIIITLIVMVGYVAHAWAPPSPKQQTTQSGK